MNPLRPHNVTKLLRITAGICCLVLLGTAAFLPERTLMPVVLVTVVLFAILIWWTTTSLDRVVHKEKKAEAEVAFERHLLHCLLDSIPDSVYFKDADSRFLRISKAQSDRYGLSKPEDAIGKSDVEFFGEEHARRARADELHVMRTGNPLIGKEEKSTIANGEDRWVLSTKLPLRDPSGKIIGTYGVSRDITQRKKNEEALRHGEERYRSLVEATTAIVWHTPASGEFEEDQPAWSAFTGQTYDQLRGWGWLDAVHPDDRTNTARVWSAAVESRSIYEVEHRLRRRDGEYVHTLARAVPILGHDGQIREWVGVHTDIDSERRAEIAMHEAREAALAATRAKSEFLANMSHEIRTPLNGILGMAELLLDSDLTPGQHEYLELLKTSADHLLTVINDILDFSKIEAGKLDIESVPFDLREVLDDTVAAQAARVTTQAIEVVHRIAPDVPTAVAGDPHRIRQVVANLLGNALKFTEKGEVILEVERMVDSNVHAQENGDAFTLQFSVRDTGIGIPKDVQARLFQAFSQADTSTTRRFGGTGLGLAISARLVEMMGGRIWLESEVGRGSTFHFTAQFLPASLPKAAGVEPATLRGMRTLVVDDNATNRRILIEMLNNWGLKPTAVESGPDALQALTDANASRQPFSLVLLDAMMPEMDGFMLAERIKQIPDLDGTIVMMLSSAGLREDAARCRKLGIDAYLTKPVRQSVLLDQIMTAVSPEQKDLRTSRTPRPAVAQASRKLRILVAEDNAVNQRLTTAVLAQRGHDAVVVGTGRLALEILGRERFDAVLMDVQMPEMDGLEAAAAIRAREWVTGQHTPIIAMTAHAMMGDREQCLASGMDGYISKPISPAELFALIETLVPRGIPASPPPAATTPRSEPATGKEMLQHVLDWDQALARMLGDPEFLREMAGTFLAECPRWMSSLASAVSTGNATQVRLVAHTLHGALTALAAKGAEPPTRRLESMGRAGMLAESPTALAELTIEIDKLSRALHEFAQSGPPDGDGQSTNRSESHAQGTPR